MLKAEQLKNYRLRLSLYFKQLPILSDRNRHLLVGWLPKYPIGNIILYAVVNMGAHWIPVSIVRGPKEHHKLQILQAQLQAFGVSVRL